MHRTMNSIKIKSSEPNSRSWGLLRNISDVTSQLSFRDREFIQSIGSILSETKQTNRFAVTLLHSHFNVESHEFLAEKFDRNRNLLVTSVYSRDEASQFKDLVLKSWQFHPAPEDGVELEPLTYVERSDLPQHPIEEGDINLLTKLAESYRRFEVTDRFGMAHPGQVPADDKLWVEGENCSSRYLVQEQLPRKEVETRDPIRTMWIFDDDGRETIVLGCCRRTRDNSGHTGTVHPAGW